MLNTYTYIIQEKKTVENQERPNKYVFKNMLKTTVLAQRETTTPVI
jgi:hypothetical protein